MFALVRKMMLGCLFLLLGFLGQTSFGQESVVDWEILSSIPAADSAQEHAGLAGPFVGIDGRYLLIAGGANFPNGPAWEGGNKVFHDQIYAYDLEEGRWLAKGDDRLTSRLAYGFSSPLEDGIFCAGGFDGTSYSDQCFVIRFDGTSFHQEVLPDLPTACADMAGGQIGKWIYLTASCGGKHFWRINTEAFSNGWESLPVWPGANRSHAMVVVQSNGEEDCLYLIKGRWRQEDGISQLLEDVQLYQPSLSQWRELKPSPGNGDFTLSAGTALPLGATHVLLLGGAEGNMLNTLESLGSQIEVEGRQDLIPFRDSLMRHHSGFSRAVWTFNTVTETWSSMPALPQAAQVNTTALRWGEDLILPSGEIAPCIRTPDIYLGRISSRTSFGVLNTFVLALYLFALVLMGVLLSRRQSSTQDFFLGGERIPWWAAGLSIFGTQLSAITFMAIPAKTYATDWLYFFLMMTIIMVAPFIIRFFLPFFRINKVTTAYEFLEVRFNLFTRLLGSLMYLLLQFGRLAIVLLLPSLALSVVTGIDVHLCILIMGLLSILYTVLGGMEAVIWTDVLQVIVLLGGALLSLFLLGSSLEFGEIKSVIVEREKMKILDLAFDFSTPTLWVVLIGGLASNLVQYGSDQTVVQRYLTTRTENEAAKSIRIGAWMTLPATLIFFTL
ncbi:MAG: sodium transporter, partial [Saprospiraceae bacterium]|nr:sodium transporter [Saprospiraceae bacterium]